MATGLSFAGNSLQTANILTNTIDHFNMADKQMQIYALAHANKSSIPYTSYPQKVVTVKGVIIDTTIAGLDSRIDTFKNYFVTQDQNLDIDYNGSTRRYIATAQKVIVDRPGGLLFATFELDFICTQPFGQDVAATTALNASGRTNASYTDNYTFLGSAPFQLPVITITLTAVTGTTGSIFFGNNGNGQGITVNRTWTAADVLVIDCTQKTVTVNGVAVNFTGAFPEFPPGAQTFGYVDTFTTRTFTIGITYNVMYL